MGIPYAQNDVTGWGTQIIFDVNAQNKIYTRNATNGSWKPWERLLTPSAADALYLKLTGGKVTGNITFDGQLISNSWAIYSSGPEGQILIATNAYFNPTDLTFRYKHTHASLGARGIYWPVSGVAPRCFDTGLIATTADAVFTPTLQSLLTVADANTRYMTRHRGGISVSDLNLLDASPMYAYNASINNGNIGGAAGNGYWNIFSFSYAGTVNHSTQIASDVVNDNKTFFRQAHGGNGNTWGPWRHFGDLYTQSAAPTNPAVGALWAW